MYHTLVNIPLAKTIVTSAQEIFSSKFNDWAIDTIHVISTHRYHFVRECHVFFPADTEGVRQIRTEIYDTRWGSSQVGTRKQHAQEETEADGSHRECYQEDEYHTHVGENQDGSKLQGKNQ